MINILLFAIMTLLGSLGAISFKIGGALINKNKKLLGLLSNRWLYFGGFLYFLSALINIYLLMIFDYSVVLPVTAITYIWTLAFARLIFKEQIYYNKVLGVVFIILGVCFIGAS